MKIIATILVGALLGIGVEWFDSWAFLKIGIETATRPGVFALMATDGILIFAVASLCWKRVHE